MNEHPGNAQPLVFMTRLHLTELTGLKAVNLKELMEHLQAVPGSSIYHHTHRFLQQHLFLSPEPPNDFAYWVREVLGDEELGERLASIDTIQYATIRELRNKLVQTIAAHLETNERSWVRFADPGEEFHFMKSISFILPTGHVAHTLAEFCEILKLITIDSIYFHIFEARLHLEKGSNDFSNWIADVLGDHEMAGRIARLDPYTYTMEDLRAALIKIVKDKLESV